MYLPQLLNCRIREQIRFTPVTLQKISVLLQVRFEFSDSYRKQMGVKEMQHMKREEKVGK